MQSRQTQVFPSLTGWLLCGLLLLTCAKNSQANSIQVYALFKNMVILQVDGQQRQLKKGQTSPEGITLVRSNSEQAVLEINGKQYTYQLGMHLSSNFSHTEAVEEVRIWQRNGMYMTHGMINDQPVDFMVDTGASWIAMNLQQADSLGINYRENSQRGWVSTANGNAMVYKVELDKVAVGGIELNNVTASILPNSHSDYILLGNSFLNRVDMQRQGQVMVLKGK